MMGWAYSMNGERRNIYRILMGKPAGKKSVGRQRCRWGNSIERVIDGIGWYCLD
jgi:hypothetical protein